MYTQIFKEILLEMEHDEKSIKDLAIYCRQFYNDNIAELLLLMNLNMIIVRNLQFGGIHVNVLPTRCSIEHFEH